MVSGELNDESGIFDLYGDLEDAYDKAECDGMREVVQTLDVFGIWDEGGHPPVWIMKRALLAIKGNPDEQAELAWCFDWSHEPKEERSRRYDNPRLAVYWYERAADAGVASAQCNVANIYCFTDDEKLWNGPRAVYWREKAAEQKYPGGLRGLAYCLECGKCCQGCADVVRAKALRDEADLLEKGVEEKYNHKTVEDFIRISLEIFDGNFMVDEDVERRKVFRKHPDVLKFLERAYVIDGDRETVDLCLEAIWKDLREMGEI